ncbi:hypothetical protein HPB49_004387 [Dermacentor silvarum]|uniref:Uncharacterized protein n=1 Tax=Dermacentor silvarum TaxID=543639 RepID=A0ACB8D2Z3_DERSI|nr:hypothetical protein HPB49_004387 [Dermacentor silvarum]
MIPSQSIARLAVRLSLATSANASFAHVYLTVVMRSSQFLLIFKKARDGELSTDGGLSALARLTSIDVEKAGVGGAKDFFEAKAMELNRGNRFEEEIKQEQLERKIEEEERKKRQAAFMEKANFFKNAAAT